MKFWGVWLVRTSAMLVLIVALSLSQPVDANAADARLHVLQVNACDRSTVSPSDSPCSVSRAVRADTIVASVNAFAAQVVTLQEVCEVTYLDIKGQLGSGWDGDFQAAYYASDQRCGTATAWGVAFLVKSGVNEFPPVLLGTESSGEKRWLLCGNTAIGTGFKVCTAHLTNNDSVNGSQVVTVANYLNGYVNDGAAVLLGADFNINAGSCLQTPLLRPMYLNQFGRSSDLCDNGNGRFWEADLYHFMTGDGQWDEHTYTRSDGAREKIDYIFFNSARFLNNYGGDAITSSVSDHRRLQGATTVHD
ncbi:MAG: endonuclease/exonuclease/phosphatase family protein [Geodermatophilaceae bacterium]